jgi:hypothetical protein
VNTRSKTTHCEIFAQKYIDYEIDHGACGMNLTIFLFEKYDKGLQKKLIRGKSNSLKHTAKINTPSSMCCCCSSNLEEPDRNVFAS